METTTTSTVLPTLLGAVTAPGTLQRVLEYLIVAMLWGVTTPFIHEGASKARRPHKGGGFFAEVLSSFKRWRILVPYLVNQLGSVAFYLLVARYPLAPTAVAVNLLTFAFTLCTESLLQRTVPEPRE
eukprot:GHVU01131378.1.p1 GENE.GHVU01131378.1~~GHVU01131378.1.p1  ORF type:complete len:127 (+),score=13.63 GHVU01131378.1:328-708(+)